MGAARSMLLDQRRGGLAESAGMHLLRDRVDPALLVELDCDCDPAPAGGGADLCAAVLSLERAHLLERRGKPQDLGRVEGGASRRHFGFAQWLLSMSGKSWPLILRRD